MTIGLLRSVRFAFVTLLLGLTVYAVIESALGGRRVVAQGAAEEGLSTCGTEAQPCALEAVSVVVEPAPAGRVRFAADEGLAACGRETQPCMLEPVSVEAERQTGRLASAQRVAKMTVRAKS